MRPRNLNEVSSSVVTGMSRSINRSAQPTEDQTREGSRKGASREEVIDEVFDGDGILYDEYLDEMGEYGLANWSIDTWKEYFEKYEMGLDPEVEDKFLEAHRNG